MHSSDNSANILTRNPPKLSECAWKNYNLEFQEMTKIEWTSVKKGLTSPEDFIANINVTLANYLQSRPEFQKHTRKFFIHNPTKEDPVEKVRKQKVFLNKEAKKPGATEEIKYEAKQTIRMYSHMLKVQKEKKPDIT